MARILVADDQASMRSAVRAIVAHESDLDIVAEAVDGASAVSGAQRHRPDVVVLDVRMPGVNGLQATRLIAGPGVATRIPVIVMTTYDLDEYVFAALQNGAAGFLLKETLADTLVPAIRAAAGGQALVAPDITKRLIDEYATLAPPVRPDERLEDLSERELEVLRLVARGLSNADIAATLVIQESTVKSHITGVLAKLGVRSRVQAVIFAYEQGLVRVGRFARG